MVIRMRHTKSHTGNRRSHHAIKVGAFAKCSKCKAESLPHIMCANCGFYKGKEIVDVLKKLSKKEKKQKSKEISQKEEA